jgi:serine phosphatase RsbU (regulator of sigma subunit)
MAYCYNDIGAAFYNLGNYEKALENYFKSLKINEEIENMPMVATTLANVGGIYEEQEKNNSALEYYLKANAMATKIGAKQTIADTYRNVGGIYMKSKKFDSTLMVYEKAIAIYKEINDLRGMVVLYNKFGEAYSEQNQENNQMLFTKAFEYYEKSLEINNREIEEIEEKIVSFLGIGSIYINTHKYSEAIPYLDKALKMAVEIESLDNIKKANDNLSQAFAGLGNFKKAYESHVLFKNWSDSLKNDENIELLTQTSMQYEFDKQQKELEFIQAQKNLEYEQKQKRDRLIRFFILTGLVIVSIFSIQMYRSFQRKKRDNVLLEKQKEEIEKQKEEITGSIRYAKRIQTAILPSNQWAKEHLPEHFILFRPRDIVSGDYYWMNKIGNKVILAAADCTGHGVPGAFMSMLGVSFLNEIVNKNNTIEPHLILNQLRNQVKLTLDQTGKEGEAKDGMDIAVCVVDFDTLELQYAGAYNPMYLFRNGEIIETKADKMPIGIYIREKESFTNNEHQLQKGDTFYIFSDGYADQFGGPKGGKLKSGPFKELLAGIQDKSMADQREILNTFIDDWIGEGDQIDDMIILGIRV